MGISIMGNGCGFAEGTINSCHKSWFPLFHLMGHAVWPFLRVTPPIDFPAHTARHLCAPGVGYVYLGSDKPRRRIIKQ